MMFELRIKVGRRVMFSNVGTLDQCKEWIEYWTGLPTCRKYEHIYTLRPTTLDTSELEAHRGA